jgi:probable F420-dependent oxidoreductase
MQTRSIVAARRHDLDLATRRTMTPAFGILASDPRRSWDETVAMVRHAETCGFSSVCIWDHPNFPGMDPVAGLAALAARTSSIRLWANVLVVPYRSPGLMAHAMACVDVISGGRLILGLGAGWDEREFRAYGIRYESLASRRTQLADAICVVDEMWRNERATYVGKSVQVLDATCEPKPVQKPRPPIWVGSHGGMRALREVVVPLADGWNIGIPSSPSAPPLDETIATFRELCGRLGRDPAAYTISTNLLVAGHGSDERLKGMYSNHIDPAKLHALDDPARLMGRIDSLRDLGVSHIVIGLISSTILDDLTQFTETVVQAVGR